MAEMKIIGITVSVELKKSTYGGAEVENRYVSLKAETPPDGQGLDYDEAFLATLEVQLKAWEAVMASEAIVGNMDSTTFNTRVERARRRSAKFKTFFQEKPE